MLQPTEAQLAIRDATTPNLLVIAPAGCGKTEALALRIQGMLKRGDVSAPRRVLVVTFSNRARDNIRERLQGYLSAADLRDLVTVANFHGLSARLFRAHANVIGLDPAMILPENDWVRDRCREKGFDFNTSGDVQKALREAKQEPRTDAEVEALLAGAGHEAALAIERERVAEGRLTYDDMPRVAELILAHEEVADLYRCHFGAVVVDEFQDLTPQQLRIVNAIGKGRTTYAGDLAQGIYGFAGAKPAEVFAAVQEECSETIEFAESHRSSPAVLGLVNSLAHLTSCVPLTSADPASWPGGGLAAEVWHRSVQDEGAWVTDLVQGFIRHVPSHRIGIITRLASRRQYVEEALAAANVRAYRWDDGLLDTETARRMKSMLARFSIAKYEESDDKPAFLRDAADFDSVVEPTGRENLADALGWCADRFLEGVTPSQVSARIIIGDGHTLTTAPGVHLLTGHAGKGQQFDWVIVVGFEEGSIPDFRETDSPEGIAEEARILSVMMSRARHGVILSRSAAVPTKYGNLRAKQPSRFLTYLSNAGVLDYSRLAAWLQSVHWGAIAAR
ncbi:ATP-dependent helicase [Microbacterium sp. NPDC096154]|uniref:ATP-dependent helicase n=1 Tax=Microbacterium sp. NPDC096154 TaxID=3155549 RepID=UPI0033339A8B